MNKDEKNTLILECTGLPYDGVDALFEMILVPSSYKEVMEFIDGRSNIGTLSPGEPFFHACSLANLCFKTLLRNSRKTGLSAIGIYVKYIIKWMDVQSEKLSNTISSQRKQFENSELSEFQLSQKIQKGTAKDALDTAAVLETIQRLLTKLSIDYSEFELLSEFAVALEKLQKKLRLALNIDPILSKKRKKAELIKNLDVIVFDSLFAQLFSHIARQEFLLAEAFSNKCLAIIYKLNASEQNALRYLVFSTQAYVAANTHDIDMLLYSINKALEFSKSSKAIKEKIKQFGYFSRACVSAGQYFEQSEEIDKAIKYYRVAFKYSKNQEEKLQCSEKLKALTEALVKQLATHAKSESCKVILDEVKSYPSNSRFDLYFKSPIFMKYFYDLLKMNKMIPIVIPNQSNALALVINNKFNVDVFTTALSEVEKLQHKDHQKELKRNRKAKARALPDHSLNPDLPTPSIERYVGGASGSHPRATITKPKKPKPVEVPVINIPKWAFLNERKSKPLERVEFLKAKKVFDPHHASGTVSLCVNGLSGRWFACINPRVLDELEALYPGEGLKLNKKFCEQVSVANDFCVPCFKEMKKKSDEVGVKFLYFFKIRLLGDGGIKNVRIYAKILDETVDGKKLVVFTAINPNSHVKHSRPLEFDMPEEGVINNVEVAKLTH